MFITSFHDNRGELYFANLVEGKSNILNDEQLWPLGKPGAVTSLVLNCIPGPGNSRLTRHVDMDAWMDKTHNT